MKLIQERLDKLMEGYSIKLYDHTKLGTKTLDFDNDKNHILKQARLYLRDVKNIEIIKNGQVLVNKKDLIDNDNKSLINIL